MNVILSIKPEYCDAIGEGRKKYEFRRRVFRMEDQVDLVFMYATAPVSKIVGAFMIGRVIHGEPRNVWTKCKKGAGISEEKFFQYFQGVSEAHAIETKDAMTFRPVDPRHRAPTFVPPQSFCYASDCLNYLCRIYERARGPGRTMMGGRDTASSKKG